MTDSPQHILWIQRGSHWQLAVPLVAFRDRMRRYGYTVYDIGNDSHLDGQPPEDHTPYSETGWPIQTPYGWVTAVDIMPPPSGSGLPSLQALGQQMHDDRIWNVPGIAWLKYMNWGPNDNSHAVHDSWQPNYVRRTSSDVGHTHLSGRSDHVTTASPAELAYDPVARLRGQLGEDFLMALSEHDQDDMYRRVTNIDKILWYALYRGVDVLPEPLMSGTGVGTPVNPPVPLEGVRKLFLGADVNALANALVPILGPMLNVDEQAVKDALVSPDGQAAIASALALPAAQTAIGTAAFDAAQRAEQQ